MCSCIDILDFALFDTSPLLKNISNFVPPIWKLHNLYCHIVCNASSMINSLNTLARSVFCRIGTVHLHKTDTFFYLTKWRVHIPIINSNCSTISFGILNGYLVLIFQRRGLNFEWITYLLFLYNIISCPF